MCPGSPPKKLPIQGSVGIFNSTPLKAAFLTYPWKIIPQEVDNSSLPIGPMYGIYIYIYTYIYHKNQPNVGNYTIHGSYGLSIPWLSRYGLFSYIWLVEGVNVRFLWAIWSCSNLPARESINILRSSPNCSNTSSGMRWPKAHSTFGASGLNWFIIISNLSCVKAHAILLQPSGVDPVRVSFVRQS